MSAKSEKDIFNLLYLRDYNITVFLYEKIQFMLADLCTSEVKSVIFNLLI